MIRKDYSTTYDGINNNTYEKFFIEEDYVRQVENKKEYIISAIQEFTMFDDYGLEYITSKNGLIRRDETGFIARMGFKEYPFMLLDFFMEADKDELRSERRYGQCFNASLDLANIIEDDCKVSVGYLHNNSDRIMHAVLVKNEENFDMVFDYTMNLIMQKDDYQELTDFKIVNEISGDKVKKDRDLLLKLGLGMSIKFYSFFRDEIMSDFEKNKKVLKL